MISGGVEISSPEVEERWFVSLSHGCILFFNFFLISCVICFRYKKAYAARGMKRKKPRSHNNHPLHLLVGRIKHPETMGKAPLA